MSVHLHVRSCYTLLQSTLTVAKIAAAAKRCGYTAVALTDKHVMHGAMAFYHACKKEQIKPIFGMEVDVLEKDDVYGFVLLAKNDHGYQNLMKLSTWLNTGEETRTLDLDTLAFYAKDCIVITNGDQNQMETLIVKEELTARTISIVGLSVAVGIGVIQAPGCLGLFPDWARTIFGESAVVMSSIMSIALNLILPREEAEAEELVYEAERV